MSTTFFCWLFWLCNIKKCDLYGPDNTVGTTGTNNCVTWDCVENNVPTYYINFFSSAVLLY